MNILKLVPIAALALVLPGTAQITTTVSTGNAGGVVLTPGTGPALKGNWTNPYTFSKYEPLYLWTQSGANQWYRDYVYCWVSPPRTYSSFTYNYVSIYNYAVLRNGSASTGAGTTKDATGAAGKQIYTITLKGNGPVVLDTRLYGNIYGNSTATMTLKGGGIDKTWSYSVNGYNYKPEKFNLTVSGTTTLTFTTDAKVTPSGPSPGKYYNGYFAGIYINVLDASPGTFTVDGTLGCTTTYSLAGVGTPQRGTYFDMKIKGMAKDQACFFLYGTNKDTFQGFLKLPLPLGYMGAPGCKLGVDFYFPWARTADAAGEATMRLYLSQYYSGTYYIQGLVMDSTANTAGLVLTGLGKLKY